MKIARRLWGNLWVFALGLAVIVGVGIKCRPPTETRAFRKNVLKSVPESVETIRFTSTSGSFGIARVLRFKINTIDVNRILQSRPFKKYEWVSYWNHAVHVGFFGSSSLDPRQNPLAGVGVESIAIHDLGQELPTWFRVNDWEDPKAFVFHQKVGRANRDHYHILIYNEKLCEAYFIFCSVAPV